MLLLSRFMFANVFCYVCNIFCSCFHAKNNNNNNNKASFRTFERCSRSKRNFRFSTHRLMCALHCNLSSKSLVLVFKVCKKKVVYRLYLHNRFWYQLGISLDYQSFTWAISWTKLLSRDSFCSKSWANIFILVKIASSVSSHDSEMPESSVNDNESCWKINKID